MMMQNKDPSLEVVGILNYCKGCKNQKECMRKNPYHEESRDHLKLIIRYLKNYLKGDLNCYQKKI